MTTTVNPPQAPVDFNAWIAEIRRQNDQRYGVDRTRVTRVRYADDTRTKETRK